VVLAPRFTRPLARRNAVIAIIVNLDVMLARRKMKLSDLSAAVGVNVPNLSVLKTGKAKAIRFSTLEAICRVLRCQPGEILEYRFDRESSLVEEEVSVHEAMGD
jgi:putative transcriptional regulator